MSTRDFAVILDKLVGSGVLKVVRLYGLGEPLMDLTLHEKIALAAGIGLRTEVTSNATLMSEVWAERLIQSQLAYLRFSIYDEDVSRQLRLFWNARERSKSETPKIHVSTLDASYASFAKIQATYGGLCDSMSVSTVHNWAMFDASDDGAHHRKEVCPLPFYQLQVAWNGDVMPCCVAPHDLVVGNLLTDTLDEVWNGDRLRTVRDAHLSRHRSNIPACATCDYLHTTRDNLDAYHP
jgi:radical SAM protein with 4Fe4S-binding SPASM domain